LITRAVRGNHFDPRRLPGEVKERAKQVILDEMAGVGACFARLHVPPASLQRGMPHSSAGPQESPGIGDPPCEYIGALCGIGERHLAGGHGEEDDGAA
jgi:hypothetical protein